jgi:ubiquinone/menaquinone biosynthesis C-methylase UbiE
VTATRATEEDDDDSDTGADPDRTAQGWDAVVGPYDAAARAITGMYAAEAIELGGIRPGEKVLDVAAGTGAATFLLARRGASVVAVDYAASMIDRLREHIATEGLTDVSAEVMDGGALDLPDDQFDAVTCIFGIIFYPDRAAGFSEMYRVLKPGGRAVVTGWSSPEKVPQIGWWGQAVKQAIPDLPPPASPPAVFSLADPDQFKAEMEQAGFEQVRIVPITNDIPIESPEKFWDDWHAASPVFTALIGAQPDKKDAIRAALIDIIRAQVGDGPGSISQETLIGYGVKR